MGDGCYIIEGFSGRSWVVVESILAPAAAPHALHRVVAGVGVAPVGTGCGVSSLCQDVGVVVHKGRPHEAEVRDTNACSHLSHELHEDGVAQVGAD